jgi:hypothetical protein
MSAHVQIGIDEKDVKLYLLIYVKMWRYSPSSHNFQFPAADRLEKLKHIVAYLLKARTVEAEKRPSLGNARTQQ